LSPIQKLQIKSISKIIFDQKNKDNSGSSSKLYQTQIYYNTIPLDHKQSEKILTTGRTH